MINNIIYMGVEEAEKFIPQPSTIIISILSPNKQPANLSDKFNDILRLWFHDSIGSMNEDAPNLFNKEQANNVIEFINKYHEKREDYQLIVHCEAGISRSAAIAVFAASECDIAIKGKIAFLNTFVLSQLVKAKYPMYCF